MGGAEEESSRCLETVWMEQKFKSQVTGRPATRPGKVDAENQVQRARRGERVRQISAGCEEKLLGGVAEKEGQGDPNRDDRVRAGALGAAGRRVPGQTGTQTTGVPEAGAGPGH